MIANKRLLFVALHRPGRSPSQRFRFEQFMPHLEAAGWQCDYAYMLDEEADEAFYTPGAYFKKARIVLKGFKRRLADIGTAKDYDVIFVQRESFVSGSTYFERKFSKSKAKLVFDFDDAIWLLDVSDANRNLRWLKDPSKTGRIIRIADHVIAGNQFLADYAIPYNSNTTVLPTVVDTSYFKTSQPKHDQICVGWSGSQTTNKHFQNAVPFLKKVKAEYGDQIRIAVISERQLETDGLPVDFIPWQRDQEVSNLDQLDIGIMPLPDDDWAKGKCGFKGIQYMSMSKATIMSPVGVNTEIISHGNNGLLAQSDEEWFDCLCQLIDSEALRTKLGNAGRAEIEQRYSITAVIGNLLRLLDSLVASTD